MADSHPSLFSWEGRGNLRRKIEAAGDFPLCTLGNWGNFPMNMAEGNRNADSSGTIEINPVVVVQEIGQKGRGFLREIGSMFWFIVYTFTETMDNIRRG